MRQRRMNTRSFLVATGIALVMTPSAASAQSGRWSVEGRLNATVPTGSLRDERAESGLGLGADLFYTFQPNLSAYAGLSRHAFGCRGTACDELVSSGLQGGLKFLFGTDQRALPWLRGGIMLHEADFGGERSGLELGAELGGGIDLAISPGFSLSPSLRYHTYAVDIPDHDLSIRYFTVGLGAHFHFTSGSTLAARRTGGVHGRR